jgi:cytochrome b561
MTTVVATRSAYSRAAIVLHWVIAAMILGNIVGGLVMGQLLESPDPEMRQIGFVGVQLHKSFGLTVLVLSVVRLVMRLIEGFPPLPAHMTGFERFLARFTHWGFYALMILMPLSGWVMVSASPLGFPTLWFGLFEWPHLPVEQSRVTAERVHNAHELLAFTAIGLILLHVAGALKHHFLDRDDVLARMLPFVRRRTA